MKCFSTILAAITVCGSTLLGTEAEWSAFITSAPSGTGFVVPIGTSSYVQGGSVSVGDSPQAIAITPDGRTALVADQGSDQISVVDIATWSTTTVSLPTGTSPKNIGITPDGTKAVVVGDSPYTVAVLDLTTNPISISSLPFETLFGTSLAITPDGKKALVGGTDSLYEGISILDLTTTPASFDTNIVPGLFDGGLAVTPDGRRAIAATKGVNTATMIDLSAQPHPVQIHTVTVGPSPFDVAITPDGKRALVLYAGTGLLPTGGISVLNLTTTPMSVQTLNVPLSEGDVPTSIAITPDGKKAVVTLRSAAPSGGIAAYPSTDAIFFDLTTDPISILSTPMFSIDTPTGVAITPDQAPTAQFTYTTKGSKVTFDASGSTSPVGGIRHYHWKFGDGHKVTTTTPIVTHTYHHVHDKRIVARLIVTNMAGTSTEVTFTGKTVSNNGGPSAVRKQHLVFHHHSSRKGPPFRCMHDSAAISPFAYLTIAQ